MVGDIGKFGFVSVVVFEDFYCWSGALTFAVFWVWELGFKNLLKHWPVHSPNFIRCLVAYFFLILYLDGVQVQLKNLYKLILGYQLNLNRLRLLHWLINIQIVLNFSSIIKFNIVMGWNLIGESSVKEVRNFILLFFSFSFLMESILHILVINQTCLLDYISLFF